MRLAVADVAEDELLVEDGPVETPPPGCGAGRLCWRAGAVGGIWCGMNHGQSVAEAAAEFAAATTVDEKPRCGDQTRGLSLADDESFTPLSRATLSEWVIRHHRWGWMIIDIVEDTSPPTGQASTVEQTNNETAGLEVHVVEQGSPTFRTESRGRRFASNDQSQSAHSR
uniref:Uncharacterized protein n=1 Tax=Anopheles atroparvus TaxID=41427 RepID=A0A182IPC4_ANOAO